MTDDNEYSFDEEVSPLDALANYEEDITRVDTEQFIYSLPYENTAVMLFQFMGFEVKEISPMLNLSLSQVYRITVDNKKRANKRYNYI